MFCKNVQSCEAILQEVASKGHLEHVRESVEALQYTMEEGLAFCQRLRMQYFITQLIMSGRDTVKFREISNSLHRQVSVIAAAASINAQSVIVDDFQQGEQLKAKLEELGGAAAVAADPDKMAQCTSFLKASDELMLGGGKSETLRERFAAQWAAEVLAAEPARLSLRDPFALADASRAVRCAFNESGAPTVRLACRGHISWSVRDETQHQQTCTRQ